MEMVIVNLEIQSQNTICQLTIQAVQLIEPHIMKLALPATGGSAPLILAIRTMRTMCVTSVASAATVRAAAMAWPLASALGSAELVNTNSEKSVM